jgi:hypothetical protein
MVTRCAHSKEPEQLAVDTAAWTWYDDSNTKQLGKGTIMSQKVIFALAAACIASVASASPIIYHFDGIASGTLGSQALRQALIDISVQSDTTAVSWNGFAWVNSQAAGVARITISGFGSGVFTDITEVFDNPAIFGGGVGFTAVSTSFGFNDIIQIHDATIGSTFFSTYDLTSPTAVYGHFANPSVADWVNVGTSLGTLTVNDMQDTTFQATTVPDTGSTLPLFLAAVGLLTVCRRSFSYGSLAAR